MSKPQYTIRYRTVRGRKDYEKATSPEYQVVEGRRVVARFDFEHQAQKWIFDKCAEAGKPVQS